MCCRSRGSPRRGAGRSAAVTSTSSTAPTTRSSRSSPSFANRNFRRNSVDEQRLRRIDEAFADGDMAALRAAVDDPPDFPNNLMPLAVGPILTYAIYWSPLAFIEELLAIGADPNGHDHDGFPPLIAALCKTNPQPGSLPRHDVVELLARLLDAGADPNQRGINDWTALMMAVVETNVEAT